MSSVRTTVIQRNQSAQAIKAYERDLKRLVGRAGNLVRETAVNSISREPKTGVTHIKGGKEVRRSAAGEPPAVDTSYLVNNIFLDVDADGLGATVESRANYSSFLEFGTSKMAARPFMQPALVKNRRQIKNKYRKHGVFK